MLRLRATSRAAALTLLGVPLVAGAFGLDLDVSIPPGPTLEWGRTFPAITPRPGSLFPLSPRPEPLEEGRTRAAPAVVELERGVGSTFGLLRILTWDLAAHLEWVQGGWPELRAPLTGTAAELPHASEPLYWISVSTLLRRLLHPALVTGPEVTAHLVELGEPVLPLLEIARRQRGLGELCDDVRGRVASSSGAGRRPLPSEDARERMLAGFVLHELTAAHPYDPDAGFGARLFLMGGELEELVRGYTRHPEPFTRRNAVAALARYATRSAAAALLELAATTPDDVVLVRALAGLGAFRGALDVGPLVERLARDKDPMRRAVLAGALGRLGRPEALEAVLTLAQEARRSGDSDLLVTAVQALARLPAPAEGREPAKFLDALERAARARPANFREVTPTSPVTADLPGSTRTRGDLLFQLATLARARLDLDAGAMRDVLALRGRPSGDAPRRARFGSGALGEVLPPAQLLWIEVAARCGEEGARALREVAQSGNTDLQARAHALAHLPPSERAELSLAILSDPAEPAELAARALELLDHDRHPRLVPLCRELLARCAARAAGAGSPEERQLSLVALRALGARRELGAHELIALEHHVAVVGPADAASLRARLQARALELARAAGEDLSAAALDELVGALVDFALAHRVNPLLEQATAAVPASQIRRLLADLRRRSRPDEALLERTAEAIVAVLVGHGSWGIRGGGTRIDPPVPLEQEIVLALGRLADPAATELLERLAARAESAHRAVACLALGLAGRRPAAPTLARALLSPDPFTRLAAAESLRHLTGLEEPVDWFAGPSAERNAAAERLFGQLPR